jgi:quinoprotein glucose dehydrogenase
MIRKLGLLIILLAFSIGFFLIRENYKDQYWKVEDAISRSHLPMYKIITAAKAEELTPANGLPKPADYINWHRSHGDGTSSRYSLLEQINKTNVKDLEVAWTYHSRDGTASIQSNPVIANGVLYTPTGGHAIAAIDAASGKELWKFKIPEDQIENGIGGEPARRGLVYWEGKKNIAPRIYFPAGRSLYAVDAQTGQLVLSFGENGTVGNALSRIAPAIAKDLILFAAIKPSYEEFTGVAPAVEAYNVVTGELLWAYRFFTKSIVERLKFRFKTGRGFIQDGANPWGGMAIDEERGIAYITTGNAEPSFVGMDRPGRNLPSNSVLAIDIETGELLWSFQEIRHDIWDLDIPAPPLLTTIVRGGEKVDVVAVVTKYGNTLLLDRVNGKPIFDFRLRRAPTSELVGERTWPYQPDLELPEPFTRQVFTLDEVTDIGPKNRESVLERIENANFGFFQPHKEEGETVLFGLHGGAEWSGAAADPETGVLYVSSNDIPWVTSVRNWAPVLLESNLPTTAGKEVYIRKCSACHGTRREGVHGTPQLLWISSNFPQDEVRTIVRNGRKTMGAIADIKDSELDILIEYLFERDEMVESQWSDKEEDQKFLYGANYFKRLEDVEGYPGAKPPWGLLNAIDLNTGKLKWKVPLGEYEELTERGLAVTGTENFGGPTVTAGGLVFVSGTKDNRIRAFDKSTGEELWSYELPFRGSAPPATYQVKGRQYMVIPATGGGVMGGETGDALVAFALPPK